MHNHGALANLLVELALKKANDFHTEKFLDRHLGRNPLHDQNEDQNTILQSTPKPSF